MKGFQKLALVSAIAALPMTGFAMEALDDSTLSGVTGQDGITLGLNLNATLNVGIEDTDGHTGAPNPGLILLVGHSLNGTANVVIDAGENAGGSVLRVGVSIPTLTMNTGNIYVAPGTDGTNVAAGIANVNTQAGAVTDELIKNVSITLNDLDLGIELGDGATNFLSIATTSVLTIDIGTLGDAGDSFVLNDLGAGGGGSLTVDQLSIQNVDLDGITANITTAGLEISTNSALSSINLAMMGVAFGDASASPIGNIYITGLNMSGQTITISGH
jgi:hypothetical protein